MDLRDRFAAHFAAALVDALAETGDIARRAYDLAEAMMAERARRASVEERSAIVEELHLVDEPDFVEEPDLVEELYLASLPPPAPMFHTALLDEPEPPFEPDLAYDDDLDPRWLEPPYDPSWDVETRWNAEPSPRAASTRPPPPAQGPGLVRTRPETEQEERKERLG